MKEVLRRYRFQATHTLTGKVEYLNICAHAPTATPGYIIDFLEPELERRLGEVKLELIARDDGLGWEPVN